MCSQASIQFKYWLYFQVMSWAPAHVTKAPSQNKGGVRLVCRADRWTSRIHLPSVRLISWFSSNSIIHIFSSIIQTFLKNVRPQTFYVPVLQMFPSPVVQVCIWVPLLYWQQKLTVQRLVPSHIRKMALPFFLNRKLLLLKYSEHIFWFILLLVQPEEADKWFCRSLPSSLSVVTCGPSD